MGAAVVPLRRGSCSTCICCCCFLILRVDSEAFYDDVESAFFFSSCVEDPGVDKLRSSSNMAPFHVKEGCVELEKLEKRVSKANFSSAVSFVHVLSNQAHGVHV